MEERKDLAMRSQRGFSLEFKRQVVEELLSGESRPAQLCRRYNISSSLLYHWKRQYSRGQFNNEPTEEATTRLSGSFTAPLDHAQVSCPKVSHFC